MDKSGSEPPVLEWRRTTEARQVRWAIVGCLCAAAALFGLSRLAAALVDREMGVLVLVIFGPAYCFLALAIVTLCVVYLWKRVRSIDRQ